MRDAAAIITLDNYVRRSFDGPDAEYVDGEIVERAMPKLSHSEYAFQTIAFSALGPLRMSLPRRLFSSSKCFRLPTPTPR